MEKKISLNVQQVKKGIMIHGDSALTRQGNEFYSYAALIAIVDQVNNTITFPDPYRSSVTTSKHISAVKSCYLYHGFKVV